MNVLPENLMDLPIKGNRSGSVAPAMRPLFVELSSVHEIGLEVSETKDNYALQTGK